MQVVCKTAVSLFGIEPVRPISLNRYGQVGLLCDAACPSLGAFGVMQPVPHWERLEEVCCGAGAGGERSVGLRGLVLRSQGTRGHLFSGGRVPGLAPGVRGRWGLRGISPALAGKLGVG